jgi:D-alanyl-lipoteichoic acid acyltransferase DltB (MBOAT superfamily)
LVLFPTFTFACFFAIVLPVGWWLHARPVPWKLFMLAASYVFYGWIEPWWVLLLMGSTAVNFTLAQLNARSDNPGVKQASVVAAVVANLGLLGLFKYFDFFSESVGGALDKVGMSTSPPLLDLALPVGISFFTFQAMSYVIDVHRGDLEPAELLDVAVYLAFFPQLVAGPIVRATEFLPQLNSRRDPRHIDLTRALLLISAGLFKKVVISSYMADAIADDVFAFPDRFSAVEIIVGIYAYATQIYADFSGYTDIAIGVALLMGFRLPKNFDRPYAASSIQDFWRRWHMTLSRWLRDYLYISLGGNRKGVSKTRRNLFLTMFLGGLWHGAAWTFVVWGALHGIGLGVERHRRDQARHDQAKRSRPGTRPTNPAPSPATAGLPEVSAPAGSDAGIDLRFDPTAPHGIAVPTESTSTGALAATARRGDGTRSMRRPVTAEATTTTAEAVETETAGTGTTTAHHPCGPESAGEGRRHGGHLPFCVHRLGVLSRRLHLHRILHPVAGAHGMERWPRCGQLAAGGHDRRHPRHPVSAPSTALRCGLRAVEGSGVGPRGRFRRLAAPHRCARTRGGGAVPVLPVLTRDPCSAPVP